MEHLSAQPLFTDWRVTLYLCSPESQNKTTAITNHCNDPPPESLSVPMPQPSEQIKHKNPSCSQRWGCLNSHHVPPFSAWPGTKTSVQATTEVLVICGQCSSPRTNEAFECLRTELGSHLLTGQGSLSCWLSEFRIAF